MHRSVAQILPGIRTREGGGFVVRRPFPTRALDHFDPFLLLDEMGPSDYAPGEAKGTPDHPHRGFETVTYMLEGRMRHRDSQGNEGELGPGDVQWMTAGAGVVHSEMPHPSILERGGRVHGFQLWVNLPRRDKKMRPRYQEIPAARIPEAQSAEGACRVRVIAGESLGARAVIDTRTPILYLHVRLAPGARLEQPVARDFNVFAFVVRGEGRFGRDGQAGREGDAVLFAVDGETVAVEAAAGKPLDFLLLGGQPIGEPVVRYGPFVMNTVAEIHEAIEEFQSGRMGEIVPERV